MKETKAKNRSTGQSLKSEVTQTTLKQNMTNTSNTSNENMAQTSTKRQQRPEEQLSPTLYQPQEAPKQPDLLLHDVVVAGGNKFEVVAFLTQTNTSVPTYMFKRCSAPFDAFYATLAELKEFYAD